MRRPPIAGLHANSAALQERAIIACCAVTADERSAVAGRHH